MFFSLEPLDVFIRSLMVDTTLQVPLSLLDCSTARYIMAVDGQLLICILQEQ